MIGEAEMEQYEEAKKKAELAEAFHPSEYIKDEMRARKWLDGDLAKASGLDGCHFPSLWDVVNNDGRIDALIAVGLATAFGTTTELWLNLQKAWDTHQQNKHDTHCVTDVIMLPSNVVREAIAALGDNDMAEKLRAVYQAQVKRK